MAETGEDFIERLGEWRNGVGNGGVGVGMNRATAVMGGERRRPVLRAAGWPCGVCGRDVGGDSMQCAGCHGRVRGGVVVWREACAK